MELQINPRGRKLWEIVSVNGRKENRKFKNWDFAEGDIINSKGDGLISIDNQKLNKRLILDYRNSLKPITKTIEL